MRIGWIGIGKMGLPMASHLLRAGHAVRGFDPQPAAVAAFVAASGAGAASIQDAARDAEAVISCLPHDAALREAATGPDGVLAAMAPGAVFVDTSTVSPGISQQVAQAAAERGVDYVRSAVSGNPVVAQASRAHRLQSSGSRARLRPRRAAARLFRQPGVRVATPSRRAR